MKINPFRGLMIQKLRNQTCLFLLQSNLSNVLCMEFTAFHKSLGEKLSGNASGPECF